MKNFLILAFFSVCVSCGKTSDSKSDSPGGNLPDPDRASEKHAFVLQATDSEESVNAVFYDEDGKVLQPPEDKNGNPKNYPVGARAVRIHTTKNLDKVLIFTCCGVPFKELVIERETDSIWKVTGFNFNKDSKAPMVITLEGKDFYLKSPLKAGLTGIRKDFKDALTELSDELGLSSEQLKSVKDRVNKILMDNLNFVMDKN